MTHDEASSRRGPSDAAGAAPTDFAGLPAGAGIGRRGRKPSLVLLNEVEAAYATGFVRFQAFRQAVKKGLFPKPDLELPDGPRWAEDTLRAWLEGRPASERQPAGERELIERLLSRARQAPTSGHQDRKRR